MMTEGELRMLIGESQEDGFKALFQQYHSYVYAIIWEKLRTVGSAEDAEECLSDVFADVFFRFGDIRKGSLQAYIGTVAKRTAIDRYRRICASRGEPADDELIAGIADDTDLEADVEKSERNRLIYEKIRSLGEPDATLIVQKYFYERKSKDIAKDMGMTAVAVRVRLNRALKRLKKLFTDEHIGGEDR